MNFTSLQKISRMHPCPLNVSQPPNMFSLPKMSRSKTCSFTESLRQSMTQWVETRESISLANQKESKDTSPSAETITVISCLQSQSSTFGTIPTNDNRDIVYRAPDGLCYTLINPHRRYFLPYHNTDFHHGSTRSLNQRTFVLATFVTLEHYFRNSVNYEITGIPRAADGVAGKVGAGERIVSQEGIWITLERVAEEKAGHLHYLAHNENHPEHAFLIRVKKEYWLVHYSQEMTKRSLTNALSTIEALRWTPFITTSKRIVR